VTDLCNVCGRPKATWGDRITEETCSVDRSMLSFEEMRQANVGCRNHAACRDHARGTYVDPGQSAGTVRPDQIATPGDLMRDVIERARQRLMRETDTLIAHFFTRHPNADPLRVRIEHRTRLDQQGVEIRIIYEGELP
jgi:hypothetical protein